MSDESFDDWDIDSYRTEHECDEHWEIRKNFMEAHKGRIPEDELVCLAQVFVNIELLGCRYPNETMIKVAELAKGVVEEFREKRKDKLKRTFVTASDAASSKISGKKRKGEEEVKADSESPSKNSKPDDDAPAEDESESSEASPKPTKSACFPNPYFSPPSSKSKKYGGVKTYDVSSNESIGKPLYQPVKQLSGPFSDFVLFVRQQYEHPVSTLDRNAALNKHSIRWNFEKNGNNEQLCKILLNNELVASASGETQKKAKELAATAAIEKLQESCYTVKVKALFFSDTKIDSSTLGTGKTDGKELGSDNVGMKIMKMMGWEGGGLGSKQQGIEEPIQVAIQVQRKGLGQTGQQSDIQSFKKKARNYIKDWLNGDSEQDLVFSSEFNSEERKAMHEIASQLSLNSKSYGTGESRHLVISKKPSPWLIVEELVNSGGSSDKYELIYPTKMDQR